MLKLCIFSIFPIFLFAVKSRKQKLGFLYQFILLIEMNINAAKKLSEKITSSSLYL